VAILRVTGHPARGRVREGRTVRAREVRRVVIGMLAGERVGGGERKGASLRRSGVVGLQWRALRLVDGFLCPGDVGVSFQGVLLEWCEAVGSFGSI
jgi:hypothetical protein